MAISIDLSKYITINITKEQLEFHNLSLYDKSIIRALGFNDSIKYLGELTSRVRICLMLSVSFVYLKNT